ncbi:hypothetical protein LEMLEM_LOCUS27650, partial [Lemmus lemmus]
NPATSQGCSGPQEERETSRVVAEELFSSVKKKPEGLLLPVIPWLPVEKTCRRVSVSTSIHLLPPRATFLKKYLPT